MLKVVYCYLISFFYIYIKKINSTFCNLSYTIVSHLYRYCTQINGINVIDSR